MSVIGYGSSQYGSGGGGGSGDLLAANNLSDVASASTSLSNLGGIGISTLTINTGEIAAGSPGTQDINATIPSDHISIMSVSVTRTAGTSASVSVWTYTDDTFATVSATLIGSEFAGATIGTSDVYGPAADSGITSDRSMVCYHDNDASSELHLRVGNFDGAATGTFQINIKYFDIGAFP